MRAPRLSTASDAPTADNARVHATTRGGAIWRPVERLGRGGTAEIWRAVDGTGREAALKRPREEWRGRPEAASALAREHHWLQALAGDPFVATLGLAEHHGLPMLVLEYLPGGDLVSLVGAPAVHWLPPLKVVARALSALHTRGVAHGDLKARNVLFAADGTARVIDLTSVGPLDGPARAGTAAYRPAGQAVTGGRADAFALAVLTYELCCGRLPFGPEGQAFSGQEAPGAGAIEEGVARLVAVVRRELAGGAVRGLSPLLDVIESVRAG